MKTSIIIQARLGSKRLPNKIFKKVNNKTILEIIYKRVSKSKKADDIIFAIPKNRENLKLKNFIKKKLKAKLFLGPEEDVLKRYYMTAKKFKSDVIVRITSDCPFADPSIIDGYIDILKRDNLDYVYNGHPHTYPDGFDVEVFNFKSLRVAHKFSKLRVQKEGVTKYFRDNLKKFKTKHINSPIKNISQLRVTLDEEDDFKLISSIFDYFKPNIYFNWLKIVELAKFKKSLFKVNSAINNNEGGYMDNNQKLWKRANSIIPGGNSLLSKNPDLFLPGGWPTYYSKAKKIYIWDLTKKNILMFVQWELEQTYWVTLILRLIIKLNILLIVETYQH